MVRCRCNAAHPKVLQGAKFWSFFRMQLTAAWNSVTFNLPYSTGTESDDCLLGEFAGQM